MQKNRKKIIDTALKVLAQNPMASMDQIAETAGIGRATLYRHFRSRELLIRDLYFEAQREFEQVVLPILNSELDPYQKLRKAIETLIPLGASFHFMMYEPWHTGILELEQLYQDQLKTWRALVSQLKAANLLDPNLSVTWIALCLDSLIFTAWEGIHSGDIARNDAGELVLHTLMNGVGKNRADENGDR